MSDFRDGRLLQGWQRIVALAMVCIVVIVGGWRVVVKPALQDTFIGESLTPCFYWNAQYEENEAILAFSEFFVADSAGDSSGTSAAAQVFANDSTGIVFVLQYETEERARALRRKRVIDSARAACRCDRAATE